MIFCKNRAIRTSSDRAWTSAKRVGLTQTTTLKTFWRHTREACNRDALADHFKKVTQMMRIYEDQTKQHKRPLRFGYSEEREFTYLLAQVSLFDHWIETTLNRSDDGDDRFKCYSMWIVASLSASINRNARFCQFRKRQFNSIMSYDWHSTARSHWWDEALIHNLRQNQLNEFFKKNCLKPPEDRFDEVKQTETIQKQHFD